jgi:hypothetical protein
MSQYTCILNSVLNEGRTGQSFAMALGIDERARESGKEHSTGRPHAAKDLDARYRREKRRDGRQSCWCDSDEAGVGA